MRKRSFISFQGSENAVSAAFSERQGVYQMGEV
jgi:hypothetical protein